MDPIEHLIQSQTHRAVDLVIQLGPVVFRLVSDVPGFLGQQYFSSWTQKEYSGEAVDFELWCLSQAARFVDLNVLLPLVDSTCRSKNFAAGYYVTDHFGTPVYMVTRGQCYYVFGEHLERIVWPYFVKYFLMLYALSEQSLHLKAAACSVGGAGTLLLGRGGSGKTVFLTQLCIHGAQFISNSHSIVKHGHVSGVASSIRIRPGPWHEHLINSVKTSRGLVPGELIIDPCDAFAGNMISSALVRNVCVLDFTARRRHLIRTLSEQEAYDYAEQFSLALNVYRLEEDLLDLYKGDFAQFSLAYSGMKTLLRDLIHRSRCYHISTDILLAENRDKVLALLASE